MSRKVFDKLASAVGILAVITLLIAGGLLTAGHNYVNSSVRNQLAMQQVYFPPAAAWAHPSYPEIQTRMIPYLKQYSGQELLTGPQAEAYADHFIAYHLAAMPYGGVYSKVSAASMAAPKNAALATEVQTVFRGTTLRGLLLEAYGFWKMGQIMLWGAMASFVLAAFMAILVGLGFWHASKAPAEERIFEHEAAPKGAVTA